MCTNNIQMKSDLVVKAPNLYHGRLVSSPPSLIFNVKNICEGPKKVTNIEGKPTIEFP